MKRIRLHILPGTDGVAALAALAKALSHPLDRIERAKAEKAAAASRAGFAKHLAEDVGAYGIGSRALQTLAGSTRGKNRKEWQQQSRDYRKVGEGQLRYDINHHYHEMFRLGKRIAGSEKDLEANERELIRRLANNEAQYAINMLVDIETGEYTMPIDRRLELYGNALEEIKWLGFLYADLSQDRYVKWIMRPEAESCIDCCFLAGRLGELETDIRAKIDPQRGPTKTQATLLEVIARNKARQGGRWGTGVYRVQELVRMAIVPQSGTLACTTNCKCSLREAQRPRRKLKQAEQRTRFRSLMPKVPTMRKRTTEQARRERLAERAVTWAHEHQKRKEPEVLKPYR